jgi:hypothetical protein
MCGQIFAGEFNCPRDWSVPVFKAGNLNRARAETETAGGLDLRPALLGAPLFEFLWSHGVTLPAVKDIIICNVSDNINIAMFCSDLINRGRKINNFIIPQFFPSMSILGADFNCMFHFVLLALWGGLVIVSHDNSNIQRL